MGTTGFMYKFRKKNVMIIGTTKFEEIILENNKLDQNGDLKLKKKNNSNKKLS